MEIVKQLGLSKKYNILRQAANDEGQTLKTYIKEQVIKGKL